MIEKNLPLNESIEVKSVLANERLSFWYQMGVETTIYTCICKYA